MPPVKRSNFEALLAGADVLPIAPRPWVKNILIGTLHLETRQPASRVGFKTDLQGCRRVNRRKDTMVPRGRPLVQDPRAVKPSIRMSV